MIKWKKFLKKKRPLSNLAKISFHSAPFHPLSEHLHCSRSEVDPKGILRNKWVGKIRKRMWDFQLGDLGWDPGLVIHTL